MDWIRRVSLVRRVTIGFAIMATLVGAIGAAAAWVLAYPPAAGGALAGSLPGLFATAAGASVALSLVAGWLIRASVKDSVESTVHCVVNIAAGDLDTKIESPGKDEFSWLRYELNSMRKKLRSTVVDVRAAAESVRQSSEEIASGNHDLSTRTEQMAARLQSTASSMEQITATVTQSVETASQADQLAASAAQSAARGGQVVAQVTTSMREISESSRRIADIIGVIDGIAFQTNILALNAAVEAARAGEQGRGFAVVASEVRSLASRSAEAAKEIKNLISSSVTRVESGARLVDEAGKVMGEIDASVKRVNDLMNEISSAANEQRNGIVTVNEAVTGLDSITQQNAALVEQAAAAATSLHEQATQLAQVVSIFKVGNTASPAPVAHNNDSAAQAQQVIARIQADSAEAVAPTPSEIVV